MNTLYRGIRVSKHNSETIDKKPTQGVYRGVKWHSEDIQPIPTMKRGTYRGVDWVA